MFDFAALLTQCAPAIDPNIMASIVKVESGFNPFAIGVVGGYLARQPKNNAEAIATVKMLLRDGWNFSLGLSQINRYNLPKYNLTIEQAFEPCDNLRVGSMIFNECYQRAEKKLGSGRTAIDAAYSCYYSGNFSRGFEKDSNNTSYVERVNAAEKKITPEHTAAIPVYRSGQGRKMSATPLKQSAKRKTGVRTLRGNDSENGRYFNDNVKSLRGN